MKSAKSILVLKVLLIVLIISCQDKEEPRTDFTQFVIGVWKLSDSYTASSGEEIMDECNRRTTYTFRPDGVMNINPSATAYDENNDPYCLAVLNDGLGVDVEYRISEDRLESDLGSALLEKLSEHTLKISFKNEDLGVLVLER